MQTRLQILIEKLDLKFTRPKKNMDGWYLWRVDKTWPENEHAFIECADGIMLDTEVNDSGRVEECEPYGEFAGPIIDR